MSSTKTILSCEHGGNDIPPPYRHLFAQAKDTLQTHRGYDIGALKLFTELQPLADFSCSSETSRLLVELNRSLHHPSLFSEFSRTLGKTERKKVIDQHYLPYRLKVETQLEKYLAENKNVLHISVHSFTPVMKGVLRKADIGLLYDPSRPAEKDFCTAWKHSMKREDPSLRIRMNYPYRGTADGFTTYLRKKFDHKYAGIELEVNQGLIDLPSLRNLVFQSLHSLLPTNG